MTSDLDRLLELEALGRDELTPGRPCEAQFRAELASWFRANKSRLKEWEADAKRYRWLRADENGVAVEKFISHEALCIEELDAAIDAARKET